MDNSTVEYSVIIPVYNEQEVLETTWKRLTETMRGVGGTYELLFVDDGSRDGSAAILRRICEQDPCSKMLSFSRNFGQQAAMSAGIDYSRGKAIVFIDADLQDPPEVIPRMIEKWNEGYEIVYGKRLKRKGETVFKKVTAALFYRLLRAVSDREVPVDVGDFRLGRRSIRNAFTGDLYDFAPTLPSCTPGDLGLAVPAKVMRALWNALKSLDTIVPGVLHPSTVLYYPEIKTYANKPVFADPACFRAAPGLYLAGDGAGTSRGITAAWASGMRVADGMLGELGG